MRAAPGVWSRFTGVDVWSRWLSDGRSNRYLIRELEGHTRVTLSKPFQRPVFLSDDGVR